MIEMGKQKWERRNEKAYIRDYLLNNPLRVIDNDPSGMEKD